MKVLIFGGTGMVGQGVLRECLLAADVDCVVTIGRNATGQQHQKLREIVHPDLFDYESIEKDLSGFDACFFCLGVSSVGMKEADYTRITFTLTLAAAQTLARLNPQMILIYVSGVGTDSSEHGRSMWARVKGRTENSLLRLPFRGAYMFRPGLIEPMHGIRSRTKLYQFLYSIGRPLFSILRWAFPNQVVSTEDIGQAMLNAVRRGYPKQVLEPRDIRVLTSA
jgi:uncharacterized protein YbjT (DUF2867 family)